MLCYDDHKKLIHQAWFEMFNIFLCFKSKQDLAFRGKEQIFLPKLESNLLKFHRELYISVDVDTPCYDFLKIAAHFLSIIIFDVRRKQGGKNRVRRDFEIKQFHQRR